MEVSDKHIIVTLEAGVKVKVAKGPEPPCQLQR